MLAGFQRFDRPQHVHMIRQRVVDDVNLTISQQLLITAVGFGDAK